MDEEKIPKLYKIVRVVCVNDEEGRRRAREWRMNPFTMDLIEAFRQLSEALRKDGYKISGVFGDKVTNTEDESALIGHYISFLEKK